jgi:hypothetical protein
MKSYNTIFIVFAILVALSLSVCHDKPTENINRQILFDNWFQETKGELPPVMTIHFPQEFNVDSTIYFSGSDITEAPSHLVMIRYSVDSEELNQIIQFAESNKCNLPVKLEELENLGLASKYEANSHGMLFLQKILVDADTVVLCELTDSAINKNGFLGHTLNDAKYYILKGDSASSESFKEYSTLHSYPFRHFTNGLIVNRNENLVAYWTVAW